MALLMICSRWIVVSFNPVSFDGWLHGGLESTAAHDYVIVIVSALWVFLSLARAIGFRQKTLQSDFLIKGFYLDRLYHATIARSATYLSQMTMRIDVRWIDGGIHMIAYAQVTIANLVGWFDRFIVDGLVSLSSRMVQGAGAFIRSFQEGKIQLYIFWSSMAIIIFLIWTLF